MGQLGRRRHQVGTGCGQHLGRAIEQCRNVVAEGPVVFRDIQRIVRALQSQQDQLHRLRENPLLRTIREQRKQGFRGQRGPAQLSKHQPPVKPEVEPRSREDSSLELLCDAHEATAFRDDCRRGGRVADRCGEAPPPRCKQRPFERL